MRMEFENGVLRVENAEGRRWQLANAEKPRLSFEYDALVVSNERALRRIGASVHPLAKNELEEVASFIQKQQPPPPPPPQKQLTADLKAFTYGLINTVVARLEYDNLLDVQITGREDSTDLYASEARRILAFVDSLWNAYHGLIAQIGSLPDAELKSINDYANMMPTIPDLEYFRNGPAPVARPKARPVAEASAKEPPASKSNGQAPLRPVSLESPPAETADFTNVIDRALVFDDFFSATQLHVLEQWALQTPHWMLANSAHDEDGHAQHRIWGASYIEPWRRSGWAGLPPVLFSTIATIFQKLNVTITEPRYIGLNGQSRGQDASTHEDCERDLPGEISILVYIGEETDGDLVLYDKGDPKRSLHRIPFKPNRVIAFDGSVPHQAFAPTDDKFRMSMVIRGQYECRRSNLMAAPATSQGSPDAG